MKKIFPTLISFLVCISLYAQCPLKNTAFQHGEKLTYELYYNWKFVWMKAGTAIFLTTNSAYNGKEAFRSYLITRTSSVIDNYFCMRDTLEGRFTSDNVPLYYRKGAFEGKKYRRDEVWYNYDGGKTNITQTYQNPKGVVKTQKRSTPDCVYDMMSLMQRCRSMKPSDFKAGEKKKFKLADGDEIETVYVEYKGTETIKAQSKKVKYRCLVYAFVAESDGKNKEIIRFFISDDDNHIPVRLDMNLKFGTAKAFLLAAYGLKNPQTSIVK